MNLCTIFLNPSRHKGTAFLFCAVVLLWEPTTNTFFESSGINAFWPLSLKHEHQLSVVGKDQMEKIIIDPLRETLLLSVKETLQTTLKEIVPQDLSDLFGNDERKKAIVLDKVAKKTYEATDGLYARLQKAGFFEFFKPNTFYLARLGAIFGGAIFLSTFALNTAVQQIQNYLSIGRSKYILPISKIGRLDRYKKRFNRFFSTKKPTVALSQDDPFVQFINTQRKHKSDTVRLAMLEKKNGFSVEKCSAAADLLNLDIVAVSAVSLLQANTGIELWNDIIQIVHKNPYKTVLVIDQAELLSTYSKEYTKHEDTVRMLASSFQSASAVFANRCIVIGLTNNSEKMVGPFEYLCNWSSQC
ncbi:hypothetical protein IPH25_00425 [bacterium]|nr:MAG: hypothetical protein IPG37_02540 [bacterium]QQR61899.1 MAG: hypothetical protein IPH25_00425 [bacterium]